MLGTTAAPKETGAGRGGPRWGTAQLAKAIGVTASRVHELRRAGRIEGVRERYGVYSYPAWPRIERGGRERGGPLIEYIERWDKRFGSERASERKGRK